MSGESTAKGKHSFGMLEIALGVAVLMLAFQLLSVPNSPLLIASITQAIAIVDIQNWSPGVWFVACLSLSALLLFLRHAKHLELDWMGGLYPRGFGASYSKDASRDALDDEDDPTRSYFIRHVALLFVSLQAAIFTWSHRDGVVRLLDWRQWTSHDWSVLFATTLSVSLCAKYWHPLKNAIVEKTKEARRHQIQVERERQQEERITRDKDMIERFKRRLPYT